MRHRLPTKKLTRPAERKRGYTAASEGDGSQRARSECAAVRVRCSDWLDLYLAIPRHLIADQGYGWIS